MIDPESDQSLLRAAIRGNEEAFRQLYQKHRDSMFRFGYRLSGSASLAEDITHDCFLSLIRHPERFDPARASLRTYLLAAVRNLAHKASRSSEREMAIDDIETDPGPVDTAEPLRRLLQQEASEVVMLAVNNLSDAQRETIILREYEELPLAEVAAILDIDVTTAKSRLHRARLQLRRVLAPYFSERLNMVRREPALQVENER